MYGYVGAVLAEKGRQVYTTAPSALVRDAVRAMNERGVGALVVVEDDRVLGIFTERDVLRRVVDAGRDPETTRVAAVMTPDPLTIAPDLRVQEAMELMTRHRCRHLPVIEDRRLAGMLSICDILRWVLVHQEEHIRRMAEYIGGAPARPLP